MTTTAKYAAQTTSTTVTESNSTTKPGKTVSAAIEDMSTIATAKNDIEDLEIISKRTQNNSNSSPVFIYDVSYLMHLIFRNIQ